MEDGGGFALLCDGEFNREAPFVWDTLLLQDFVDRCKIPPPLCCGSRCQSRWRVGHKDLGGNAWILRLEEMDEGKE